MYVSAYIRRERWRAKIVASEIAEFLAPVMASAVAGMSTQIAMSANHTQPPVQPVATPRALSQLSKFMKPARFGNQSVVTTTNSPGGD